MIYRFKLGYADSDSCLHHNYKEEHIDDYKDEYKKEFHEVAKALNFKVIRMYFKEEEHRSSRYWVVVTIDTDSDIHDICEKILYRRVGNYKIFEYLHEYLILDN